jgi:hypothetical protein
VADGSAGQKKFFKEKYFSGAYRTAPKYKETPILEFLRIKIEGANQLCINSIDYEFYLKPYH